MIKDKTQIKKHVVKFVIEMFVIAGITGLDQYFKYLATEKLSKLSETVPVIPGIIGLRYCENTGGAFSLGSSSTDILSYVTLVAVVGMIIYLAIPRKRAIPYDICVTAIIAGGIGNLIDRFTNGFVVDYIETLFVNFAIYNFADIFITCGCFGLVAYLIYETVKESKEKKSAESKVSAEEKKE